MLRMHETRIQSLVPDVSCSQSWSNACGEVGDRRGGEEGIKTELKFLNNANLPCI